MIIGQIKCALARGPSNRFRLQLERARGREQYHGRLKMTQPSSQTNKQQIYKLDRFMRRAEAWKPQVHVRAKCTRARTQFVANFTPLARTHLARTLLRASRSQQEKPALAEQEAAAAAARVKHTRSRASEIGACFLGARC